MKTMYVYILATKKYGRVYSGVTNSLTRRTYEHQHDLIEGHTKKYHIHRLVYYEVYDDQLIAIQREKSIKRYPRQWKINLINGFNSEWKDLFPEISK